jgi:hypothetical protein
MCGAVGGGMGHGGGTFKANDDWWILKGGAAAWPVGLEDATRRKGVGGGGSC